MSIEDAKKFVDHVERDENLKKEVRAASEQVLAVAKKHGYDVSGADLHDLFRERIGATKLIPAAEHDQANCILIVPPGRKK